MHKALSAASLPFIPASIAAATQVIEPFPIANKNDSCSAASYDVHGHSQHQMTSDAHKQVMPSPSHVDNTHTPVNKSVTTISSSTTTTTTKTPLITSDHANAP